MSGLADRTERAGLIERRADQNDGSAARLWLTDACVRCRHAAPLLIYVPYSEFHATSRQHHCHSGVQRFYSHDSAGGHATGHAFAPSASICPYSTVRRRYLLRRLVGDSCKRVKIGLTIFSLADRPQARHQHVRLRLPA